MIDLFENKKKLEQFDVSKNNMYDTSLKYTMVKNRMTDIICFENFGNDYCSLQNNLLNQIIQQSNSNSIKNMNEYLSSKTNFLNQLDFLDQNTKDKLVRLINIFYYEFNLSNDEISEFKNNVRDFKNICLELYLDFSFHKFLCLFKYHNLDPSDKTEIEKMTNTQINKAIMLNNIYLNFSSIDKLELYNLFHKLNKKYDIKSLFEEKQDVEIKKITINKKYTLKELKKLKVTELKKLCSENNIKLEPKSTRSDMEELLIKNN
jgi:hypothetical protein